MIDPEVRKRWRTRTYRAAMQKLQNLLELRVLIEDAEAEGQRVKMAMIAEAASDFQCREDTVYADLATIRNYPAELLCTWIRNGVGFSHIETANRLQHIAKQSARKLLDDCYQLGDENGRVMTVKKLEAYALGEKVSLPPSDRVAWALRSLGNFPTLLKWDDVKTVRFNALMDELRSLLSNG
jgi:hypothetical protein